MEIPKEQTELLKKKKSAFALIKKKKLLNVKIESV